MPADPHDWHSRAFKSAAWWRTEADKWDALADSVNLDEGRALLESATPGPWEVTYETRAIQEVCTIHCVEPMPDGEGGARGWCHIVPPRVIDGKWIWSSQKQQTANAALIVYAVNNLPVLLDIAEVYQRRGRSD